MNDSHSSKQRLDELITAWDDQRSSSRGSDVDDLLDDTIAALNELRGQADEPKARNSSQDLWTTDSRGLMLLTPAGMRALEQNIALTDRCEELIAENDRLRAAQSKVVDWANPQQRSFDAHLAATIGDTITAYQGDDEVLAARIIDALRAEDLLRPAIECIAEPPKGLPEELFDGHAVWLEVGNVQSRDVSAVLDAVVRLYRKRRAAETKPACKHGLDPFDCLSCRLPGGEQIRTAIDAVAAASDPNHCSSDEAKAAPWQPPNRLVHPCIGPNCLICQSESEDVSHER